MRRLFLVAAALVIAVSFAVPAKADFVVGMMAYTDVGYYYRNEDRVLSQNPTVDSSVGDVFVSMPHHSRLYSKCTTEECGGYFELGVGSDNDSAGVGFANVNFRKLYGWYNFGPMTIEAGHTEPIGACRQNPTQLFGLGRAGKIIGIGFGNIYDRAAQVNLIYQGGPLYFAVGVSNTYPFGIFGTGEEYNVIPRVHLVGGFNSANFSVLPNVTFLHADAEDTPNKDSSVFGWVVEVPVSIKAGMIGAKVSAHFGDNVGNLYRTYYNAGYSGHNASPNVQIDEDGGTESTFCWGGYFDVSFGGKPLAVHLIGGIQHVENDLWENDDENTRYMLVARVPYSISGNFTLSPEIGWYNFGDDVNVTEGGQKDLGSDLLVGVQFQFVF